MSALTSFPEGLPWGEQQAFLLLDGATISDLPQRLKQLDPTASTLALYDQPPFSTLRDVSPLLVAIEHLYFLYLEMFLWTKPKGLKVFGGCCGTDATHLEEIARRLAPLSSSTVARPSPLAGFRPTAFCRFITSTS